MVVFYSKPFGKDRFETVSASLSYLSQQQIAEWASSFAADCYTSVWLVPGVGQE